MLVWSQEGLEAPGDFFLLLNILHFVSFVTASLR